MVTIKKISITCSDGYQLSAHCYIPKANLGHYPILICPATGIKQNFYFDFAHWLCNHGYEVMVFDFRGIDQSLYEPLRRSQASIIDWGQLDIPAAMQELLNDTQADQVILLGHSVGGQLLGINPLYNKVKLQISIAGSTGYRHHLSGKTWILAPIMFDLIFPLSILFKGYGATKFIGMGENLPKKVAWQWRQFCSRPQYIARLNNIPDFHQKIQCPIVSICASDDPIASSANINALLALYPHAKTSSIEINPKSFALSHIGHMLFFKKSYQMLWPTVLQQIVQHAS